MLRTPVTCLVLLALASGAASAQEENAPPAVRALEACRPLEGAEERLACYDGAVDALLAELRSGAVIAITRTEIEDARRDSVGLPEVRVPRLAAALDEVAPDAPVTVRMVSFTRTPDGKFYFETDTGQRWVQVGTDTVRRTPELPADIELDPAFGDTYFATIAGRSGIRVRRQR